MFDELLLKYKEAALVKRLLLCCFLAILPSIWTYFDESQVLDDSFTQAEENEKTAANKLLQADNQLKNLPKAEADLAFVREQLKKAEARLPDRIAIDDLLRTVGKISKENVVSVRLFEPQPEVLRGEDYKFSELGIKVSVEAREYSQLVAWIDQFSGLKSKVYLKSWNLSRRTEKVAEKAKEPAEKNQSDKRQADEGKSLEHEAKMARENMRLVLNADFSVFKLATETQIAAARALEPKGSKANQQGSNDTKPSAISGPKPQNPPAKGASS